MNDKTYRIAFFGSDEIALPFLRSINDESKLGSISAVLTQPDRRAGRGRKLQQNSIKTWALEHAVPIQDPSKPSSEETQWLKSLEIDLVIVMAYGHILKRELIEAAPSGCFNLHASLLPAFRGASPIETALAMGERESGVTLMRVVPRMDAGPIVDVERVVIDGADTGQTLRSKIAHACVPLMNRNLSSLLATGVDERPQDETLATYCRKLTKLDGALDFSAPAETLVHRIQAFRFWPGSIFSFNEQRIRIGKSTVGNLALKLVPGEVGRDTEGNLCIGTGRGILLVKELQKPGGKMLPVHDFLRGFDIPAGSILLTEPMPDLLVSRKSNSKE
jgi:methionyl-tRNA formyltransferase